MTKFGFSLVYSVLLALLGVLVFLQPAISEEVLALIICVLAIVFGVEMIVENFRSDKEKRSIWDIILGIFLIISGVYLFLNPEWALTYLPFYTGLLMLITSFIKIPYIFKYREDSLVPTWVQIFSIIVGIILALILILYPVISGLVVTQIIGISLVIDGLVDFVSALYMHHELKKHGYLDK